MRHFRFVVVLGAIALLPAAALADLSLTETFTFSSPLAGYYPAAGSEGGSSFSQFDPALGTLNSVTYNVRATAAWTGGGANDDNQAEYDLDFSGNAGDDYESMIAAAIGNNSGPASLTATENHPGILAVYIGTGTIDPTVEVENLNSTSASISSTFADPESITYNYTPAVSPVPEPSAIVLLLTLLGVVALAVRKRLLGNGRQDCRGQSCSPSREVPA